MRKLQSMGRPVRSGALAECGGSTSQAAALDTLLPFDPTVAAACEHFTPQANTGG